MKAVGRTFQSFHHRVLEARRYSETVNISCDYASAVSGMKLPARLFSVGALLVATGLPAIANFLMTPLLIRVLGLDGFGQWALIEPIIMLGAAALTLGSQYGALSAVSTRKLASGTATGAILLVIGVAAFVVGPVTGAAVGITLGLGVAAATFLNQLTDGVATSISSILRAEMKNGAYALVEGGRAALSVAAIFAFSWIGVSWISNIGWLLVVRAVASAVVVLTVVISSVAKLKSSKVENSVDILKFGFPIFIGQMLIILASNIDRYVVEMVGLNPSQLSAYVAHARIAGVLNVLVVAPLNLWYPIEAMRRNVKENHNFFFGVFFVVITAFTIIIPAVQIISPLFWYYIFPTIVFDPVLLSCATAVVAFQAMAIIWNIGALQPGRTKWNIVPPAISAIILLALGWLLGPLFGLHGVAIARLVSGVGFAFAMLVISQRISSIPMPLHRLAPVLFGAGIGVVIVMFHFNAALQLALFTVLSLCAIAGCFWNITYLKAILSSPKVENP